VIRLPGRKALALCSW